MADWGYDDNWGAGSYDDWSGYGGNVGVSSSPDYSYDYGGQQPYDNWSGSGGAGALSWEDQVRQALAARPDLYGSASTPGGWGSSVLGALGSVGSFLGQNAGTLGPLASTLGGVVSGAIGSNAAGNASAQQAEALNRGIDLSTAQWLQQQQNLAPYLQAGQQGLSHLQQLAGREQPAVPGQMESIDPRAYGMPGATPTWAPAQYRGPGAVQAANYHWTPGQGPQAADYRYTPGQTPDAAKYRYTAGAVPTLSGQELLANDPGYQFRMDASRKALEGSAAARGDLLSGGNLKALQSRSQDLASQEYAQAWNRASQQAQLREQWGQAESQMGWQQAEAASRLREQVNQIASQQGWSQAQAEAAFREQMAQQSSAQNWGQALQGQAQEWQQGFATEQDRQRQQQQWDTTYYDRVARQNEQIYGRDVARNEQDYTRQQAQYRQQLAQFLMPWEQGSTLAHLGGQATGMYGQQGGQAASGISQLLAQLGSANALGTIGQAGQWQGGVNSILGAGNTLLKNLNA